MEAKTFRVITSVSMGFTLTAALLSLAGILITGVYPGIFVLMILSIIPIASKIYAKKAINNSNDIQGNYFTTLTIVNVLSIFIVLWMTFVIVHDRVLQDCC